MLDFEYAKALAEVVLDTTCSEKEREVRLECLTQIFVRANAYLKKGLSICVAIRTSCPFHAFVCSASSIAFL